MEIIEVRGGRTLAGSIAPPAAKNSVLPLLAATLLCGEPCRLRGVPRLTDVDTSLALLTAVGARAAWCGRDVVTAPVPVLGGDIPPRLAGAMRSSVFYLAPLLVRAGQVRLPVPGGCRLGPRPVDIHLDGLAAMGARVEVGADAVTLRRAGRLQGTDFTLRLPSVGATETLLMAAACAQGTTVLRGAACEPEVEDLAGFLSACGARITGAGTPVVVIQGRAGGLDGCSYTPLPDRIAATTYAAAAAVAGGDVTIRRCRPATFATFLHFLQAAGCRVQTGTGWVRVLRDPRRPLTGGQELFASGWPGFATDAAPLAAAVLLCATGPSRIYDGLFPNRFACAAGFAALGAGVQANGRELRIAGGASLRGTVVTAPDLRGGAALVLAGLAARGKTCVLDEGHIRRGYQALPAELASLGAACRIA
ncbi:UDP-N-acetylglucosamine 1-carboxyvinyltransferase [uncultured Gemmiger sp.]|uniref:UDP-N-acetylglucosamine 1-carboxyvinyltransferase n=1 Tax=uncultured Gemmiger sp. TaxID=1623490 RepID=UPI0025DE554F|nr:UDP-N-acetylglucosamine 1-carboxyvinyltransferase [uncultured Gemmiger sp.]